MLNLKLFETVSIKQMEGNLDLQRKVLDSYYETGITPKALIAILMFGTKQDELNVPETVRYAIISLGVHSN